MTDTQNMTRLLMERRDEHGNILTDVYEHFQDGHLFSTVWRSFYGEYKLTRIVYAEPQKDFNCEFGLRMPVKAFSEKLEIATDRVFERSYETPDGTTLKRDYITGQCTTRRSNGSEVTHDTAMLQKMAELAGDVRSF